MATVTSASGESTIDAATFVPSFESSNCFAGGTAVQYDVTDWVGTSAANRSRVSVTTGSSSARVCPAGTV